MTVQQVVEVDVDQIEYVQQCKCGAIQAVFKNRDLANKCIPLESGFILPGDMRIEPLMPRWCGVCNDDTRFPDD